MGSKQSAATRRARRAAHTHDRRAPRRRSRFWDALGASLISGLVVMYVVLFGASFAQSAAGAAAASVVGVAWAACCCVGAHRLGKDSLTESQVRWRSWGWLLLPTVLVSPVATHWAFGRIRGGRLYSEGADPAVLDVAQSIGWVAVAVVVVGCPVAWGVGRRHAG